MECSLSKAQTSIAKLYLIELFITDVFEEIFGNTLKSFSVENWVATTALKFHGTFV